MDSLKSVLPSVLRKRGLYAHAEAAYVTLLAQRWLEKTLPELKGMFVVQSLSHTTLSISCRHSIASQECQGLLPDLLSYLKKEVDPRLVTEIRLTRSKS